jgi:2-oxoglutarate ferredoxin oxidoreductase subunit gamma
MRGGTANCSIVISDEPIGSPIIDYPNALIAMNGPSLEKFEDKIIKGGLIITNSSLVEAKPKRADVEFIGVSATEMASDMGNLTYANIIILGKLLGKTGIITKESFEAALKKVLPEKKHFMIPDEMKALVVGYDL